MNSETLNTPDLELGLAQLATLQKEAGLPKDLIDQYNAMYHDYYQLAKDNPNFPSLVRGSDLDQRLDQATLDIYSKGHERYYGPRTLQLMDKYDVWDLTIFLGGMYAGKSTFVMDAIDFLAMDNIKTALYITGGMEEDIIISRATSLDNPERPAAPFGGYKDDERSERIDEMLSSAEVIVLDEFTFAVPDDVIELIKQAKAFPNKKLILLGLDTNYLGINLPIIENPYFKHISQNPNTQHIPGKSYIYDGQRPKLSSPKGEGTIRYLNVGSIDEPIYLLDLGIGKLIISKTKAYIRYFPSIGKLRQLFGNHEFFSYILDQTRLSGTTLSSFQLDFTNYIDTRFGEKK